DAGARIRFLAGVFLSPLRPVADPLPPARFFPPLWATTCLPSDRTAAASRRHAPDGAPEPHSAAVRQRAVSAHTPHRSSDNPAAAVLGIPQRDQTENTRRP